MWPISQNISKFPLAGCDYLATSNPKRSLAGEVGPRRLIATWADCSAPKYSIPSRPTDSVLLAHCLDRLNVNSYWLRLHLLPPSCYYTKSMVPQITRRAQWHCVCVSQFRTLLQKTTWILYNNILVKLTFHLSFSLFHSVVITGSRQRFPLSWLDLLTLTLSLAHLSLPIIVDWHTVRIHLNRLPLSLLPSSYDFRYQCQFNIWLFLDA